MVPSFIHSSAFRLRVKGRGSPITWKFDVPWRRRCKLLFRQLLTPPMIHFVSKLYQVQAANFSPLYHWHVIGPLSQIATGVLITGSLDVWNSLLGSTSGPKDHLLCPLRPRPPFLFAVWRGSTDTGSPPTGARVQQCTPGRIRRQNPSQLPCDYQSLLPTLLPTPTAFVLSSFPDGCNQLGLRPFLQGLKTFPS